MNFHIISVSEDLLKLRMLIGFKNEDYFFYSKLN
jgi:hypothetical protein